MARHPTMRTPDGRWQVKVITTRGGQSFRVKDLHRLPAPGSTGMPSPGSLVRTIGEVRALIGDDFDRLVEVAKPPKASARVDGSDPFTTWTSDELGSFLAAERGDRYHAIWHVLAMTGMRRGEALGLGWRHVDLEKGTAQIRRTLVDIEDGNDDAPVWSDPKTRSGHRTIQLDAGTVAVLRARRADQARERLMLGPAYRDYDLVLCWDDGRPYHPERVSRVFGQRAKRHGLPVIRVHDLRHLFATIALEAGVHPKVVQQQLGHANISITLDVYSHVSPAMQSDAAERVARLIGGQP